MNDILAQLAFSLYHNKGVYALFLGSGLSKSAGISTGWDIVIELIERIAAAHKMECSPTPEEWYKEMFKEEPHYSNLLDRVTQTQDERLNLLRPFFEPTGEEVEQGIRQPTIAHQKIAKLVKEGFIRVIVTTNFDRLVENSLKDLGIEPTVISHPNHIENAIPLIHSSCTVVKVNGDYLETSFLNLKSELSEYDERLKDLLNSIFENFGLIISGWSGDWDLALVDILKSSNKFRFSNFFTYVGQPSSTLKSLSEFRRAKLIQIADADSFFNSISENVDVMGKALEKNPLSPKLAVAKLKKYLSKEERLISLNDLICVEVESVINVHSRMNYPTPNKDETKRSIDKYFASTVLLGQLVSIGAYWGKDFQDEIWVRAISRIANNNEISSNYSLWQRLVYLPAVILVYTIGIACLLKHRYDLLNKIVSIDIVERTQSTNILLSVNPAQVIDKRNLRDAYGNSHYTPMNELLFSNIRGIFTELTPDDRAFEDNFDFLEYILALKYLLLFKDDWAPIGRFGYRRLAMQRHYIAKKLSEIKLLGDDSDIVKQGLFNSYRDFNSAVEKLNGILQRYNFD